MNPDILVGAFSLVCSLAYAIASWNLPDAAIGDPMAPKIFPLAISFMATLFSALLFVRGVKRGPTTKKNKHRDPGYIVLIGSLIVCCLGYAAILETAGFIPSTMLFLGAMLFLVNGVEGWKANVLTTVSFSVGVWYIFEKIFALTLP